MSLHEEAPTRSNAGIHQVERGVPSRAKGERKAPDVWRTGAIIEKLLARLPTLQERRTVITALANKLGADAS